MTITQTRTEHRDTLLERFQERIVINPDLARKLVSYQADKDVPFYGWFKYREGFTSSLVHYLLRQIHPMPGVLLDPFAGSGTALFGAASAGWEPYGIEVLPVGVYVMQARIAAEQVDTSRFASTIEALNTVDFAHHYDERFALQHIAITKGAFPTETERELVGYIAFCNTVVIDEHIRQMMLFAAFCILEDISYTRKDGQYLRWDARSERSQGKRPFDKGKIPSFRSAILVKLHQMLYDLRHGRLFDTNSVNCTSPVVVQGSCLELLPTVSDQSVDVIVTSPPYCNRYDYTRTYALELVYLNATHEDVTKLRQMLLSCTVENKTKHDQLHSLYSEANKQAAFSYVDSVFHQQAALQEVLYLLEVSRVNDELNNPHIVRMVHNYFYEMCFVIFEMARLLKPGGHIIMVNDNVQYAGEEVPADLILSSFAESFGLVTEKIWTLPRGKGNSSQQMGLHGRSELRKCVYTWRKPTA